MEKSYINMDINILRTFVEADPSALNYLKDMLDYRNLRIEEAYYSKLCYTYDHDVIGSSKIKEVAEAHEADRQWWEMRTIDLNKIRRNTHNQALTSFYNFLQIGYRNALDYIYVGPELTPSAIKNYENYPLRSNITNTMFSLLNSIDDNVVPVLETNTSLKDLQQDIHTFNRAYNVKRSITSDESKEDDGGIEFDFNGINNLNNTENL